MKKKIVALWAFMFISIITGNSQRAIYAQSPAEQACIYYYQSNVEIYTSRYNAALEQCAISAALLIVESWIEESVSPVNFDTAIKCAQDARITYNQDLDISANNFFSCLAGIGIVV